jgi:hypothetical protein
MHVCDHVRWPYLGMQGHREVSTIIINVTPSPWSRPGSSHYDLDSVTYQAGGCGCVRDIIAVHQLNISDYIFYKLFYKKQYGRSTRLTWVISSLRQTTDFTPGYMAERSCREELYGPRWHDADAYTIVWTMTMCYL